MQCHLDAPESERPNPLCVPGPTPAADIYGPSESLIGLYLNPPHKEGEPEPVKPDRASVQVWLRSVALFFLLEQGRPNRCLSDMHACSTLSNPTPHVPPIGGSASPAFLCLQPLALDKYSLFPLASAASRCTVPPIPPCNSIALVPLGPLPITWPMFPPARLQVLTKFCCFGDSMNQAKELRFVEQVRGSWLGSWLPRCHRSCPVRSTPAKPSYRGAG